MTRKLTAICVARGGRGSLTIDSDVAQMVRALATLEHRGKDITGVVRDMLAEYVRAKHQDVKLVWSDDKKS